MKFEPWPPKTVSLPEPRLTMLSMPSPLKSKGVALSPDVSRSTCKTTLSTSPPDETTPFASMEPAELDSVTRTLDLFSQVAVAVDFPVNASKFSALINTVRFGAINEPALFKGPTTSTCVVNR
jgi:hypothetical protein